jgi:hypothetical protein
MKEKQGKMEENNSLPLIFFVATSTGEAPTRSSPITGKRKIPSNITRIVCIIFT